jgi:autotransporter adhesin|nr:MAG TPA: hypothetical protein [Caudoviricetes sp.]
MNNTTKTAILSAVFAMATMGAFANPVAFGNLEASAVNPTVSGYNSVAVGANTSINGTNTIVVGRDNTVNGDDNIILGGGNGTITANQTTVLGYNNYAGNHQEQTIVGANSTLDAQGAISVGTHNVVRGMDAVVIGNNASAPVQNSVAIGTNSQTYEPVGFGQMDINGTTHVFAGENPNSTVSFGSKKSDTYSHLDNYNRQLQNVSAGRLTADSLDAVNGSQLYAAIDEINTNGTRITRLNTKVNTMDGRVTANEHAIPDHEQRIITLEHSGQQLLGDVDNKINQLERDTNQAIASVSALGALHWNGFDAHNKFSISTGFGHYKNANAGALGAFYAPNENVMFYVGQSFGSAKVTNASVNFKIGKTTNVKRDEVKDLKERVEMLENLLSK